MRDVDSRPKASRRIVSFLSRPMPLALLGAAAVALLVENQHRPGQVVALSLLVLALSLCAVAAFSRVDLRRVLPPVRARVAAAIEVLTALLLVVGTFAPYAVLVGFGRDLWNVPSFLAAAVLLTPALAALLDSWRAGSALAVRLALAWSAVLLYSASFTVEISEAAMVAVCVAVFVYSSGLSVAALRRVSPARLRPVADALAALFVTVPFVHTLVAL